MALTKCKACGKEISQTARRCPHCGNYVWNLSRIGCLVFILIGLAFFIIFALSQK